MDWDRDIALYQYRTIATLGYIPWYTRYSYQYTSYLY